jgi:hypothetical protein
VSKERQTNDQPVRGIDQLNTKITAEFRRLLDWHCDQLGTVRPHRPNLGEFIEERLRPILEKEGKPPADYRGAKKKPRRVATNGRRGPRRAQAQTMNSAVA